MFASQLAQNFKPVFVSDIHIIYKDKLLMFKRSKDKKRFPGWWALPGGHIDQGEDPLQAAIREVQEETGVIITPEEIKLKAVALNSHLDLEELYIVFIFLTKLKTLPILDRVSSEGFARLININKLESMSNILPPAKYFFDHVLNDKPGIIYNNSEWENSQLKKVVSETLDINC